MNQTTNYSTIKLYKTDILTIEKNSMFSANANVSNFVAYLNTCWKETIDYFQYQKSLGMNLTIKLNKSQDYINLIDDADDYPYNYVGIKNYDDDRTFYYFITNFITWKSKNTIELTLDLDTVATYWDQLKFDARTLVHREHTDRFIVPDTISVGTKLIRKIDDVDEGLVINQVKENTETIWDANLPESQGTTGKQNTWYLVYRSEFEGTDANQNPVNCYLCADEDLQVQAASGDVEWSTSSLDPNYIYLMYDQTENTGATLTVENGSATIRSYTFGQGPSSSTKYKVFKVYYDHDDQEWLVSALYYNANNTYQGQDGLHDLDTIAFLNGLQIVWATTDTAVLTETNYKWLSEYYCTSLKSEEIATGNTNAASILSIASFDRTDSRLLKIIELPYCPVGMTYNSTNQLWSYPSGWQLAAGKLKLTNLETEFVKTLGNFDVPNMTYTVTNINNIAANQDRNDELESKLYNSAFSSVKLVYDSFVMPLTREHYKPYSSATNVKMKLEYKQTNTINSDLCFHWEPTSGTYKEEQDFETYLLAKRNNESMIYNSEYLNYIRNGYNYDKKANSIANVQNAINAAIQIGTSGGILGANIAANSRDFEYQFQQALEDRGWAGQYTTADLFGTRSTDIANLRNKMQAGFNANKSNNLIAATMGFGIGSNAAQSLVNMTATILQQRNTLQQKLASYQAQAASTSGSDDIDLMKFYSDNTLKIIEYGPTDKIKEAILDLFYYAGYATEVKKAPNLYTRANWNYIQCEPVFEGIKETNIPTVALTDIKNRFANGLTVFHNTNDLEQVSNNTEISIISKIN